MEEEIMSLREENFKLKEFIKQFYAVAAENRRFSPSSVKHIITDKHLEPGLDKLGALGETYKRLKLAMIKDTNTIIDSHWDLKIEECAKAWALELLGPKQGGHGAEGQS
jgi:hypothetical protein